MKSIEMVRLTADKQIFIILFFVIYLPHNAVITRRGIASAQNQSTADPGRVDEFVG
jgi:hypothetical protein